MNSLTIYLCFVFLLIECHQCARYGGSRGRGGGGGSPRYTTRRPYTTHRPYSSTYRPPNQQYSSTYRPPNQQYSSTYRPPNQQYGSSTNRPFSTTRRSYRSTSPANVGFNNIPPKPGSTYNTGAQGPQKIKIVNKYNYHYPGYYSLPVQNPSHPGYFYSPSSYHYGVGDTGSTALGFFLGYSLAKLTTPTFSHYSFYDGYRPRYDHYEVHHYYHNKDSVPQNQKIEANTIVGCVGDSTNVCPANTTSLCTSNGALMCVVSATSTVPCTENRQVNCVTSTITCVNNTAPECKNADSTTISIPCVSNARVDGEVKYVNNTVVQANATNPENGTTTTTTQLPVTTSSTQYPITTTPPSSVVYQNNTENPVRRKRDAQQSFCVTVVALPAKKQETEGEQFLKDAKFIFEQFVDSSLKL